MEEIIKVGMADIKVCKAPDALTTLGLGSCVGICLWDSSLKIGGLAHIMLPDSRKLKNRTEREVNRTMRNHSKKWQKNGVQADRNI